MKPEELADLIFGGTDVCDIEKYTTLDCDYFQCLECKDDCVNMEYNGKNFMAVWCANGCDCHGDVFLVNRKTLPRMAKKFIQDYKAKNEINVVQK